MENKPVFPLVSTFFVIILVVVICQTFSSWAGSSVLHLSDDMVAPVRISLSGTVLSFPVKPTKVILGNKGSFGIDYVENDLAITPLGAASRSHLFVYLYGRRFSFDLSVSGQDGSSVILVRDAEADPKPTPSSLPPKPHHRHSVKATP
jgi:hypothetical protein